MKRLFTVAGTHFESKPEAKKFRDTEAPKGSKVSKGPDHIGNHGHRSPTTRHRAPQGYFAPAAA